MRQFSGTVCISLGIAILAVGLMESALTSGRSAVLAAPPSAAQAQTPEVPGAGKAADLSPSVEIEPEALAKMLQSAKGQKPVVLHVGFKNFYDQAKIPASDYAGPCSKPDGLDLLRKRVSSLQHRQLIVLYCGCCPWDKCPNIKPAYEALHAMGFTNVKVVHIAENFGANWVAPGLPTEKAQ